MAIENARLFHQRRIVEALQSTLIPARPPAIAGLTLAASYRPAAMGGGIGGDWYDAFVLAGGQVALVIGDVMGHGIGAAALMAQIRTGLRAYALEGRSPAGVVEQLNRLAMSLSPNQMTTLAYVVLDLDGERLYAVSAGHLPPLVLRPGGEPTILPVEGDPPLGVTSAATYRQHEFELPAGSTVVLVTDGGVEVRGEPLDRGLRRLGKLLAREPDLDRLCEAIARGDIGARPAEDDVAVLAAHFATLPERLTTTWPAGADALAAMRPLLRRWLARWGATPDEIYDITVAVQEASANAIEHAYAPGAASFEVDATHADGAITVVVRDRGRWRAPRGVNRGRGLSMMHALMHSVDVEHGEDGTTIVLRRTLDGSGG
jgi:anti-sigma regulatory factor (Ser/Thr protein kinase)